MACKEVLSWLRRKGVFDVQVFMDCAQLRGALSAERFTFLSHAGFAINACKISLASFNRCFISLIPRSENIIAHTLASAACTLANTMYWDSISPDSISTLLH